MKPEVRMSKIIINVIILQSTKVFASIQQVQEDKAELAIECVLTGKKFSWSSHCFCVCQTCRSTSETTLLSCSSCLYLSEHSHLRDTQKLLWTLSWGGLHQHHVIDTNLHFHCDVLSFCSSFGSGDSKVTLNLRILCGKWLQRLMWVSSPHSAPFDPNHDYFRSPTLHGVTLSWPVLSNISRV